NSRKYLQDRNVDFANSNNMTESTLGFSAQSQSFSSGATVLGKHSDQQFVDVSPIARIDTDKITTIALRLIVDDLLYKPYVSIREVNEYKVHSINEPPRIDKVPHDRPHEDFFLMNRYNPY